MVGVAFLFLLDYYGVIHGVAGLIFPDTFMSLKQNTAVWYATYTGQCFYFYTKQMYISSLISIYALLFMTHLSSNV